MIMRFSKGKDGKSNILTCIRDDGSTTWQKSSDYFSYHDLFHYAIETTLGYHNAFLGLVAQGRDLDQFGTRNGVKDTYTAEEGWAESIAGALQFPAYSGGGPLSDAELLDLLVRTCTDKGFSVPPVNVEQLAQIRARASDLHAQWARLPEGGTLELVF